MSGAGVVCAVALGSNLGDRHEHLSAALAALGSAAGVTVERVSRFWETEPVGPPGQGRYLNAAVVLTTTLSARTLLDLLQRIERDRGRDRSDGVRNGPRTLDLDLLLYGQQTIREPGLEVPHPRMLERPFVLGPLAEVAPDLVHPTTGKRVESFASICPGLVGTEYSGPARGSSLPPP
ncbi:MAG: 2-amino-4-hydroxy-6-hydroxymethyldihydropteridine diphosphokinase [Phycisphaerales bacterium]|nr:2-amino-4-hydroxy-6-hydroxymethyldihydropteridine diphosphokinase [Phycisphaerales bacterium]